MSKIAVSSPYEMLALDWLKRPRGMTLAWYEDMHKRNGFRRRMDAWLDAMGR